MTNKQIIIVETDETTCATTSSLESFPGAASPNLIINGDMRIAQRGGVTGTTVPSYGGADRFQLGPINLGTWDMEQSSITAPTDEGFANYQKLTSTVVVPTPGASSVVVLKQGFEGQNLQQIKKGTAAAESLTLSFWVRSSKVGTYICELYDTDNTRQVSASYEIDTADTWEYKSMTFPPDTSGALADDSNLSLLVQWILGAGSDFTSGTLNTSWASVTNANRFPGQVNVADAVNATFEITGAKLEIGNAATSFVSRPYGEELALCQRYFYSIPFDVNAVIYNGFSFDGRQFYGAMRYPVEMRVGPQVMISDVADFEVQGHASFNEAISSFNYAASTSQSGLFAPSTTNLLTPGESGIFRFKTSAPGGFIHFDAEL